LCSNSLCFLNFVSRNTYCISARHCQMPTTVVCCLWQCCIFHQLIQCGQKNDCLDSNISPVMLTASVYLQRILFDRCLTMRQQQNLPDVWPNLSEMFAASHCVMEQYVNPSLCMKEKICFAIQQQLRQYTLPECHLVNFHGIYVCQSQPAAEFSAFPCCCHVGRNFKDFKEEIKWPSRTWPVFKDFPGL